MSKLKDIFAVPDDLLLGRVINSRVPEADQRRQRLEVDEVMRRLRRQPGVILADEVGMGKTYVALAVAHAVATSHRVGPVVVMVPAALITKWEYDLRAFAKLYLKSGTAIRQDEVAGSSIAQSGAIRYGIARHSVELMKLLDDSPGTRCQIIFLAQGAMARRQTDKWIRLALIAETLRRHGRGRASRLIQVKNAIHRYLAKLIEAVGEERAHDLGEELWQRLLGTPPAFWKDIYNGAVRAGQKQLSDDPVPKAVARALTHDTLDLSALAEALKKMPVRAVGGAERVGERVNGARQALREVEESLWKDILRQVQLRSPLLILDEAHHLKNTGTVLARQFQPNDNADQLRTGDAALAGAFDRMLFLTATPFQLGHFELVNVLQRFGDVRPNQDGLKPREALIADLEALRASLTRCQRAAIAFYRCWSAVTAADGEPVEVWWARTCGSDPESLPPKERACVDAYHMACTTRDDAQALLRPWIIRHNKGVRWADTDIVRRVRRDGATIADEALSGGLAIPAGQMLPFFLAARSAAKPSQDLLGEALCSSFEAFRDTRRNKRADRDTEEDIVVESADLSHSAWYLGEFDRALGKASGAVHPKIAATVQRVANLWESGEKVVVFAFYRHTCRALRLHISNEIKRRLLVSAQRQLADREGSVTQDALDQLIARTHDKYFDKPGRGRKALDTALQALLAGLPTADGKVCLSSAEEAQLLDIMRRFLRTQSTIARSFPLATMHSLPPEEVVRWALDHTDGSATTWRGKFQGFVAFLLTQCTAEERQIFLDVARDMQVGGIRIEGEEDDEPGTVVLPNVKSATGGTKREHRERLMRAFNTPFFPEILVCSQVMGEGVDLQRFCRHVVHHDLDWNPSTIEQRTGRIDRLACKAEGKDPILAYLPYLAGTADERQYNVMSDRERWFRVVMGQEEVARLISADSGGQMPLPESIAESMGFKLSISSVA